MSSSTPERTPPAMLLVRALVWFGVLLGCAVLSGKLLGLLERPNGSTSFDSSITSWFVDRREHWLTTLARGLSTLGSQRILLPAVAIATVVLILRRGLPLAARLVVAWGGALGLYTLTKALVGRHRPPVDIWLVKAGGASYPSGHATQSAATFLALALVAAVLLSRRRRIAVALALLLGAGVGWSRVYLGVHWTTDVLAGWALGLAWAATIMLWPSTGRSSRQARFVSSTPP